MFFAHPHPPPLITTQPSQIENDKNPNIAYGRHFTAEHPVYSRLTRESIDALKAHFRDELATDDWRLVIELKKVFGIS